MASALTFRQLAEQWPAPNVVIFADLIADRERCEALRLLLRAHKDPFPSVIDLARCLFDNGFLSFDLCWGQTDADIEVALSLPRDIPTSQIRVDFKSDSVSVSLKAFGKPILAATLWECIDADDSHWTLVRHASVSLLKIDVHKRESIWWTQLWKDRANPGPPCQESPSPERAYTFAQSLEMTSYDPEKVFLMYKLAADRGHPDAASRVGNLYIDGDAAAGVDKDEHAALHYLMIGAELGHGECMFQVGHAFQNGVVYAADFEKAVFWFMRAVDAVNHRRSAYYLGHIFHHFPGRPSENDKAAHWWRRAAEQGHSDSMFNLGLLYYQGTGVPLSKPKSLELFKESIAANPAFTELLVSNGISLQQLEHEVAAATQMSRPVKPRRKRSRKSKPWSVINIGASVAGVAFVLGLVWYKHDHVRPWIRRSFSSRSNES